METLHVELVSAERLVWSGDATMVTTRTTDGKIGIMPRHEPMLAVLVPGRVTIHLPDGTQQHGAVHGGFLGVDEGNVEIIAEVAELAHEIDVDRAQLALKNAEADPDNASSHAAQARAKARISAVHNQGLVRS
ncbi:MAG: F0F1 ATP synthase subunit epsilon [Jiangellales bacterium]